MAETAPIDAPALAAACESLQHALATAASGLHPTWLPLLLGKWPFLETGAVDGLHGRLLARSLAREGLPDPSVLAAPDGRLACSGPSGIRRGLCVLALARRPGVLRCCVEKDSRVALKEAVGDAAPPLAALSWQGRVVRRHVASWTPLHWACAGFVDWCELPAGGDRLLRQLVGMSLPCGLLNMGRRLRLAPPDFSGPDALAALADAGGVWPC